MHKVENKVKVKVTPRFRLYTNTNESMFFYAMIMFNQASR